MASSSEDLREKFSDGKKPVKFSGRREKEQASSSAASSGDDDDNFELEGNQNNSRIQTITNNQTTSSGRKSKKRAQWEVIEGYRDPNMKVAKPQNFDGILLKRRNWPMKGWHKRYFILADGILTYGKSKADLVNKNKVHGTINAYLSIVSYIISSRRILIDSSTQSSAFVCHLKARTSSEFDQWLEHLKQHRLYYQFKYTQQFNNSAIINRNTSFLSSNNTNISNTSNNTPQNNIQQNQNQTPINIDVNTLNNQTNSYLNKALKKSTVVDDNIIDNHFKQVEESLMNLSKVLSSLYISTLCNTNNSNNMPTPNPSNVYDQQHPSSSNGDFLTISNASKIHVSKSNPNLINNELQHSNSINGSPNVQIPIGAVLSIPTTITINNNGNSNTNNNISNALQNLTNSPTLTAKKIHHQHNLSNASLYSNNDETVFKYNFYQGAKSINDQLIYIYQQLLIKKQNLLAATSNDFRNIENSLQRSQRSQSVMSSISLQDSQVQFYDAIEYFTSSESSDDDSDQDSDVDLNEVINKSQTPAIVPDYNRDLSYETTEEELQSQKILTRRRKLPATCPDASQVSMWGILRKAIGKDLSKISLPVILNEPLGILQRLCEELEYSDLLDTSSNLQDPYDRMVYMAAFVISGYSSSYYRSGAKNFNPLLGETYELIRPDKGWKYIAEQVSHHPPVSSCYCQSKSFIHEQVFHAKIKFWGKSMEVHPEGYTRVTLPKFNETYQWNKIVMYVHNVMGASRKIEHYGEITIRCTNGTSCTITFPKSSNSSQKNEFYGDIIYDNVVKRKIFGQWHETFLCGTDNTAKTIWRMGAMPEDSHLYYGFTRFAMELNEFTEDLKEELPPTDSRFRPDQRNLENGQVEKAEQEKHRIEEMQRNRRKEMEQRNEVHQSLWFTASNNDVEINNTHKHEKEWIFNNEYWTKREKSGFKNLKNIFPQIW